MSRRIPELLLAAVAVVAAALCTVQAAPAPPVDRNQPIHLSADRADINEHTGVSVFTGHVVLSQGGMQLWSDTLTVHHDQQDKITRMVAKGDPARFREQPKAQGRPITGSARRIDYDVRAGIVVLEQDAQLLQGKNRFQGPRIEYDRDQDVVKAGSAGGAGGRVEITLQPKGAESNPEAESVTKPGTKPEAKSKATPKAKPGTKPGGPPGTPAPPEGAGP
ncbi:MAG TPA: lipopolysaccharide transport periplasmic protein LptA [Chromatiales bacterium]|nr:lipopolysaccharide transport periplasmic protein LptA [Chromatiales bacterium]